jgi:quercetin dioxygenase-like cupin family protein
MTPDEVADRYRAAGLGVTPFDDPPGHLYRYHRHDETRLFGIAGAGLLKLGDDPDAQYHLVLPGQELVVGDGVLHGGVAGPDGWTYLAAGAVAPTPRTDP